MIIKTIPPMPVLFFTTRTTLKDISKFVANVAQELYAEANRQGLLPTGSIHWIYTGADGKPDTEFTLDIALPVNLVPAETGEFGFKQLPAFECAATVHHGAWDHLFEAYDRIIGDVYANGRSMTGVCREQYLYMDFANPVNHITEVQIGI